MRVDRRGESWGRRELRKCCRANCGNVMAAAVPNLRDLCPQCADEFKELIGEEPRTRECLLSLFRKFMRSTKKIEDKSKELITVSEFLEESH